MRCYVLAALTVLCCTSAAYGFGPSGKCVSDHDCSLLGVCGRRHVRLRQWVEGPHV